MSAKWMGMVWDLVLTPPKREVLLAMADHADHDGRNIMASIPLIAWKTDYSEKQAGRIINGLLDDKLVYIQRGTTGLPRIYGLDFSTAERKPPFVRKSVGRPRKNTPDKLSGDKSKGVDKLSGVNGNTPDKTPDMPSAKSGDDPIDPLKDQYMNRAREQFKVFIPAELVLRVDPLTFPAAVNAIFYAYLDALADPRVNRTPAAMMTVLWEQLRDDAMGIAAAKFTADQVTAYIMDEYTAPGKDYWRKIDAAIPLKSVAKNLPGYVVRKSKQVAKTPAAAPAAPTAQTSKIDLYTQEAYAALPADAPDWYLPGDANRQLNWERAGRRGRARQDAERRLEGEKS